MDDAATALRLEVRRCVKAAGLKQINVAAHLGISEQHLSRMLLGNSPMSLDWAVEILELCGREVVITSAPPGEGMAAEVERLRKRDTEVGRLRGQVKRERALAKMAERHSLTADAGKAEAEAGQARAEARYAGIQATYLRAVANHGADADAIERVRELADELEVDTTVGLIRQQIVDRLRKALGDTAGETHADHR